jgi:hypothetical protein
VDAAADVVVATASAAPPIAAPDVDAPLASRAHSDFRMLREGKSTESLRFGDAVDLLPLGATGEMTMDPKPTIPRKVERRREIVSVFGRSPNVMWAMTTKGFGEAAFWSGELFTWDGTKWVNEKTLPEGKQFLSATLWRDHALAWLPSGEAGTVDGNLIVVGSAPLPRAPEVARPKGSPPSARMAGARCRVKVTPQTMLGFVSGELFIAGYACDEMDSGPFVQRIGADGKSRVDVLTADLMTDFPFGVQPLLHGDAPSHVCLAAPSLFVKAQAKRDDDEAPDDNGNVSRAFFSLFDGAAWRPFDGPKGAGTRVVDIACPSTGDTWTIIEGRKGRALFRKASADAPWKKMPLPDEWIPDRIDSRGPDNLVVIAYLQGTTGERARTAMLAYAPK